ncbi:hypothetical protein MMPV_007059 [Pyropia vietnamensis]
MAKQLITADGAFVSSFSLPPLVEVSPQGTPYGIVAVIGCQSGGKSTLLNTLFGTSFPVLDAAAHGRRRTTVGVWGAVAPPPAPPPPPPLGTDGGGRSRRAAAAVAAKETHRPLLVLDIEGTDSRERGDGAVAFESRAALLALALGDTVVLNMWAHDVGRHAAANYELLGLVFAHAAALRAAGCVFGGRRRARLLVVVRDADEPAVALPAVTRVLLGDMRDIWARLRRGGVTAMPPSAGGGGGGRGSMGGGRGEGVGTPRAERPPTAGGGPTFVADEPLESLVQVEFAALPHMRYDPAGFAAAAAVLARRFTLASPSRGGRLGGRVGGQAAAAAGGGRGGACAANDLTGGVVGGSLVELDPEAPSSLVPLPALPALARSLWAAIVDHTAGVAEGDANADAGAGRGGGGGVSLDLPTHAGLAAAYTASTAATAAIASAAAATDALRDATEAAWQCPSSDFGARASAIAADALASYDAAASSVRGMAAVGGGAPGGAYWSRRAAVAAAVAAGLEPVRSAHLWGCREAALSGFEDEFRPMLGGTRGFARRARAAATRAVGVYRAAVAAAAPPSFLAAAEAEGLAKGGGEEPPPPSPPPSSSSADGGDSPATDAGEVAAVGAGAPPADTTDEYSVDAFARSLADAIAERQRQGEWALPAGTEGGVNYGAGPPGPPWWKGLLIRAAILGFNYWQATAGGRAAGRALREEEEEFPHVPVF